MLFVHGNWDKERIAREEQKYNGVMSRRPVSGNVTVGYTHPNAKFNVLQSPLHVGRDQQTRSGNSRY